MPSELEGLLFPYIFGENRILGCLGGILEASWVVLAKLFGLSWPPRRPAWAPIRPQDEPKTRKKIRQKSSELEFHAQELPKSAQEPFKAPPNRWGTPPGVGFWVIF